MQQAQYLLDDEIGYAASLRDARKTLATLLAIAFGIGVFKFSVFGSRADQIMLVPIAVFLIVAVLLTIATGCILWGTWLLYTERPIKGVKREEGEDPEHPLETGKSSAALAVLNLDRRWRKILEQAEPLLVIRCKTLVYRLAYTRLARANRRVRFRIEQGRRWIFSGIVLVFMGFLLYFWTMGICAVSPSGGSRGEQSNGDVRKAEG